MNILLGSTFFTSVTCVNVRRGIHCTRFFFLKRMLLTILNTKQYPEAFGKLGEVDPRGTGNIFPFILTILILL